MWSDNGWKRITAEQAAKLHPGGTVSAHSGLFMCELCGQYVSLTDGAVQTRHFRHSAHEKSKNCPERILGAGYSISYGSQEHDLPIRITGVSSSSFRFEVGLIRAPISSLSKDLCSFLRRKVTLSFRGGADFYRWIITGYNLMHPKPTIYTKVRFLVLRNHPKFNTPKQWTPHIDPTRQRL
jgi:hypothetical protein